MTDELEQYRCSECHELLLDDELDNGICHPCNDRLNEKWLEDPDMEDLS